MEQTMSTSLKKRTFIDMILSCLLCATAFAFSVWQFISILSTNDAVYLNSALCGIVVFAELGLITLILLEIRKTGKPFSRKIINKLRIMSVILIACAIIPRFDSDIPEELVFGFSGNYDMTNLLIIFLSVLVVIISEIFVYGMSLQEDNDLIA